MHYMRNGSASFTDFAPVIRDRSALNDSRKSDALPLARDLYFLYFTSLYNDKSLISCEMNLATPINSIDSRYLRLVFHH